jgi:purine-binding chemotaxis protein CheW
MAISMPLSNSNEEENLPGITRQFLLFGQGGSLFAVELICVREVLSAREQQISPVPNTLPFLLGLTNLRGEILGVGDFGRFIDAEPTEIEHFQSRILVLESSSFDQSSEVIRMGLAVGWVEGVVSLNPDQIVSAVEVSEELAPLLKGLYDSEGRLLMILDVEAITKSERW